MVLKRFFVTALSALSRRALAAEQAFVMKRGTTMVLKRFVIAALGAAGLGALAAGPVFAQDGQIPAPRLYGDITGCTTDAPNSVTKARSGMRPSILDAAFDGVPNALSSGEQNNLAATLTPCNDGASTNDIADGFGRARDLYNRTAAARALATGEGATQTDIDRFNEALQMQEAYGGAVYDTVYEETAAEKTVRDAIKKWNDFFANPVADVPGDAATIGEDGEGAYTVARRSYSGIVINDFDDTVSALAADAAGRSTETTGYMNDYGKDMVAGFQAITGFNVVAYDISDADSTANGGDGDGTVSDAELRAWINLSTDAFDTALTAAFDAEGKLNFVQSVTNTRSTATTDNSNIDDSVAGSATITTLGNIVDHLSVWDRIVAAADKIVADADPATVTDYEALQTRAARAKAARSHVQAEMDRLLGVVRVQNRASGTGADATTEVAILRSYDSVLGELRSAENVVRSTAAALEAARGKVKESLESAGSYLSQLVKLREYEKAQLIELHDGTPPDSC